MSGTHPVRQRLCGQEERRRVRGPARLLGLTEESVGDLVAWSLLLFGVVVALGMLGAVELLIRLSGG